MTTNNLTEQWEKGELESGLFYIKVKNNDKPIVAEYDKKTCFYTFRSIVRDLNKGDVGEVLAPVPSYEEWIELGNKYDSLQEQIYAQAPIHLENQQFKELLKECRGLMNMSKDWAYISVTEKLLSKIDEVLK